MAHVSLITLGVADLEPATRFYEQLGWRRSSASVPDVVSFLQGDNVALGLFGSTALAEDANVTDAEVAGGGSISLATNLADDTQVDALLATAEQAGGRITKPAERAEWGGYAGYFVDLDGHLWEVAHNPFFPLRGDGSVELPE